MLPTGSTLGILGGGQLGRMIANEARRLGYRVAVMDPNPVCGARGAADVFIEGALDDEDKVLELTEASDLVTLEIEHIPATALAKAEKVQRLYPGSHVLEIIQDRQRQREFLDRIGAPHPTWHGVSSEAEAVKAAEAIGGKAILKSRRGGYDGKGQARLDGPEDAEAAFAELDRPCTMEAFVPFDMEISVLIARTKEGETRAYPIGRNDHRGGILRVTRTPIELPPGLEEKALAVAEDIAEALDHIGVLCVELFVVGDEVLVNEIAPRVHNSGHYTLDAAMTSQFEQHVRAICGLPLGDTSLLRPAVMFNILGDGWREGQEPPWERVLETPGAHLHLYGKQEVRPGRKMGHVVVLRDTLDEAYKVARELEQAIMGDA